MVKRRTCSDRAKYSTLGNKTKDDQNRSTRKRTLNQLIGLGLESSRYFLIGRWSFYQLYVWVLLASIWREARSIALQALHLGFVICHMRGCFNPSRLREWVPETWLAGRAGCRPPRLTPRERNHYIFPVLFRLLGRGGWLDQRVSREPRLGLFKVIRTGLKKSFIYKYLYKLESF